MSGSAYPAPIAILPIYNGQEFNYASSYLTYTKGDARYLQLTNGMTINTKINQFLDKRRSPIFKLSLPLMEYLADKLSMLLHCLEDIRPDYTA